VNPLSTLRAPAISTLLLAVCTGMPLAPAAAQCNISRTGTPDFDQRRISQLPNDGRFYCVPAAVTNFLGLLANSGYPEAFGIPSGGLNWQSNAVYNLVGSRMTALGNLMATDPFLGTNNENGRIGAQTWLDQNAPGKFVVFSNYAYNGPEPRPIHLYNLQKLGGYVAPIWGRYTSDRAGLTRNGGHMVSMTVMWNTCSATPRLTWRDPDDAGIQPDSFQSPFTSQTAFLIATNGPFRPSVGSPFSVGVLYRFSNDANRYLDGFLAIMPVKVSTPSQTPGEILVHNPVIPAGLLLPAVQAFQVPGNAAVTDLVNDARLLAYYAATAPQGAEPARIWRIDAVDGAATSIHTPESAGLLATGRAGELFMVSGRTVELMNVWAELPVVVASILLPSPADAIAYDDATDSLLAISAGQRTIMRMDNSLAGPIQSAPLPSQVPLGAEASIAVGPAGHLFVASSASSSVFILQENIGAGYTLVDTLVSGASPASPHGLQVDSRNNLFFIRDGLIEELERNAAGIWGPAPASVLAGLSAHRRLSIATSRSNYDASIMSGPEYFEISPGNPTGIPDCYANCDLSTAAPVLNVDDFTCFINAFAMAQSESLEAQVLHYANCDQSTTQPVLNVDDFTCFINAFALGCGSR
jgi:hypothetical protein